MSSTFAINPRRSLSFPTPQFALSKDSDNENNSVIGTSSNSVQQSQSNVIPQSSHSSSSQQNKAPSSSSTTRRLSGHDLRADGYLQIKGDEAHARSPRKPAYWDGKTVSQENNVDNYFSPRNRYWSNNDLCVRSIENRRTSEMKELQHSLRDALEQKQCSEERCEELEFEVVALEQQARHFKERCEFLERIIRRHGINVEAEEDEHRRRDSAYSETESIADESPSTPD